MAIARHKLVRKLALDDEVYRLRWGRSSGEHPHDIGTERKGDIGKYFIWLSREGKLADIGRDDADMWHGRSMPAQSIERPWLILDRYRLLAAPCQGARNDAATCPEVINRIAPADSTMTQ